MLAPQSASLAVSLVKHIIIIIAALHTMVTEGNAEEYAKLQH